MRSLLSTLQPTTLHRRITHKNILLVAFAIFKPAMTTVQFCDTETIISSSSPSPWRQQYTLPRINLNKIISIIGKFPNE